MSVSIRSSVLNSNDVEFTLGERNESKEISLKMRKLKEKNLRAKRKFYDMRVDSFLKA